MKPKKGSKVLVDTCEARINNAVGYRLELFVEMDGQHWESQDYPSLEAFLQALINHGYRVAMGKE